MRAMRIPRPSPALAISLLALFLSLGGVSYGVATGYIDSREIKNKSIREKDLRRNSLTTRSIREARLGKVPAAAKADVAQSADRGRRGRRRLGEQRAGRGADASRALGIQRRPSRGTGCGRGDPDRLHRPV